MDSLHKFKGIHIDEDCSNLEGVYDNELFFNCLFNKVAGLTLKDCDLNYSKFDVQSIRDALGFTLTLSCQSFNSVEYSPLMIDLFLYLLTTTKGNDESRKKIENILGEDKMKVFKKVLRGIE